jgi:phospholipid/cholesterol/gamma-HCH transport system ATP-binding protein
MAAPDPASAIQLSRVVKDFGSDRVLHQVDFEVPRGAITVLLGPSGAGKTITVRHIVGLMEPTAGAIVVDGHDLTRISDEELNVLRRTMAVVMQGTLPFTCGLFYSLNVYENVAAPLRDRTRWPEEKIQVAALANLDLVGLRDLAGHMPDQLSSGMAKRVALARAFALDARIVIHRRLRQRDRRRATRAALRSHPRSPGAQRCHLPRHHA